MTKFELHVHTSESDLCASVSGAEIVKRYHDAGYDGMVVTDHYFSMFFEWFADELKTATHQEIIMRWLKGYYVARNEGEKLGFTVLPGAEVRFDGTVNDYLIYGVDEHFFYQAPLLNRLRSVSELIDILPQDICVVQAHPFRNNMTVCDPTPLFGIEAYNGGTDMFRNQMARLYAGHYKKQMTSGSDFHNFDALGRGGILSKEKIRTPHELVRVLKSGAYSLIENGFEVR